MMENQTSYVGCLTLSKGRMNRVISHRPSGELRNLQVVLLPCRSDRLTKSSW